ncbi:MAG: DUF501 domain-containing protein [Limnochordales bacterium]|nr:DUF501 domain-containing protein [Limnochordales bacterium]
MMGVAYRCRFGRPAVIVNSPLVSGEGSAGGGDGGEAWTPLPTVFWLTCPYLVAAVGELESRGFVRLLTEEIAGRPEVAARMEQAHREYAAFRQALIPQLPKEAQDFLAARPAIREVLIHSGVGGARDHASLKCLHMHLAHYLAGGDNPVGRMVAGYLTQEGVDLAGDPTCRAEKSSTGSTG